MLARAAGTGGIEMAKVGSFQLFVILNRSCQHFHIKMSLLYFTFSFFLSVLSLLPHTHTILHGDMVKK